MKCLLTSVLIFCSFFYLKAQLVSNVVATYESEKVIVKYDLKGEPNNYYKVSAYYSTDGGKTYKGEPKSVEGAINTLVTQGLNHSFTWHIGNDFEDFDGSLKFKLIAAPTDYFVIENEKIKVFISEAIRNRDETVELRGYLFSKISFTDQFLGFSKIEMPNLQYSLIRGMIADKQAAYSFDFTENQLYPISLSFKTSVINSGTPKTISRVLLYFKSNMSLVTDKKIEIKKGF